MSVFSSSLSAIPTSSSPFRPEHNAQAGPSRDRRVQDSTLTTSKAAQIPSASSSTYLLPPSFRASSRAAASAPLTKRSHSGSMVTSPRKRGRNGTPGISLEEAETDSNAYMNEGASGIEISTTVAGSSVFPLGDGNGEFDDIEYPRSVTHANPQETSETDDGGDSILFSEEKPNQSVLSGQSGSTAVIGNMADYIPQPDPDQTIVIGPKTEETEDMGEYVNEDGENGVGDGDEAVGQEEDMGEMEESHDRNDEENEEDEGEDAAVTPAWLTEPFALVQEPEDQMSRIIEEQERRKAQKANGKSKRDHNGTGKSSIRRSSVTGWDESMMEDDVPSNASYHSGDTEIYEMSHRPVLDRTAIKRDIRLFVQGLECLKDPETQELTYKVVDRLGEGTFSSVYLAHDVFFHYYNNYSWTGFEDKLARRNIASSRRDIPVALKKILVTSSPARIENELHILESLRGCRNVSKLITAFREDDQIIIVMPYEISDDFRHFYKHMHPYAWQSYMKALLRALKDIHQRGIIHRDVKPANFLYHYDSSRGVLCDFGLAERYHPPHKPTCQHAPATLSCLHGKRTKTNDTPSVETAVYEARKRAKLGEGRIGFLTDDKRQAIKTNRAGTRGFRAPEVLLKCPDQTVAIDIWSAGVILLSILTHKFPVFNSNDDIEALLEIAAIFGRGAMERCAMLHNRTIITNVPSVDSAPESLAPVITKLNPHIYTPPMSNPTREDAEEHIIMVDQAIDLCSRLLRLDATKRITAAAALKHPFICPKEDDESGLSDMEDEEILDGRDGKCGHLHGMEGTKRDRAVFGTDIIDMHFGQGIPPKRTALCPEHEHWQERMDINVIAASEPYPVVEEVQKVEVPERGGKEKPLAERDTNIDALKNRSKGK